MSNYNPARLQVSGTDDDLNGSEIIVAGGDGQPLPEITTHHESYEEGGATYVRCTECGREGMSERQLLHRDTCTLAEADR